ncbi:hypothetical protein [Sphingobacterium corticibacter]|uniref:Uncharacterized protein n=1 Tax=Sphingobacterium corticibacter TaxID=2171749 RepID=A0A2T8HIG0_9SPHI|nr:hypothetical protein [Sphingobacterium corticibacter]PVH25112.1 hypothetical protein DC487_09275 [Sphingobacterium corticibacter]
MNKLNPTSLQVNVYIKNGYANAIPDHEDVPDPNERDHPTPLEEGDPTIHMPEIPDRGFPGEDERVLEDFLAV